MRRAGVVAIALGLATSVVEPVAARGGAVADPRFEAIVADVKATMLADPAEAIEKAKGAARHARSIPDRDRRELEQATADWLLGEAYIRTRAVERARPLIAAALSTARRIAPGQRLHADALLSQGGIRAASGDVGGALTDFHAAFALFRKLEDARSEARALVMIATLYYDANDRPNALRYFQQALDIYRTDPGLAVAIHNGRGLALTDLGRLDAASAEFGAALEIARGMDSPILTATVLNNAARSWLVQGDLAAADRAIAESRRLTTALRPRQLQLAAQAAHQRGDDARAAVLIEQALAGKDPARTTLVDRESHQTAYAIYRALHRDAEALVQLGALKRLDDEATELARSNGAALMAARFDFANQELRIAKLKADDLQKTVAFERASADTQRLLLLVGAGATASIIALLLFGVMKLRRSRDRERDANADLERSNAALGKALAAKTEFLATTSHEIRTPLNGILGMTQVMLADARIDPATRDRLDMVHGAGVTMRALVDDILDVAKIESGNLTIEPVAFDLAAALDGATRMWAEQARTKGLDFRVDLTACPGWVVADPARLRQIVFNMLSNALKFTAAGSVAITARGEDGRIRIAIEDTGIGISPEQQEEIFEAFRQADAGTTRQFGGTGLGLSICRSLSRAMGGDVTVTSAAGAGATFVLDLPWVPAADPARAVAEPAPGVARSMVIADRNPINRAMLKALIAPHAGTIATAGSIDGAIALVATMPHVRLMVDDATLRADGCPEAAVERLRRAAEGATLHVMWPAHDTERHAVLRAAGATTIIPTPIAKDALVAALNDDAPAMRDTISITGGSHP